MAGANIRRVVRGHPRIGKALHHLRMRMAATDDPVLVYSVGKVGSSAVCASLAACAPGLQVHHLHWLTEDALERDERAHRDLTHRAATTGQRAPVPTYVWRGQFLRRRIRRPRPGNRPWRVVTLVRDPIARDVSSFFQNLPFLGFDHRLELARRPPDAVASDLVERFHASYVDARPTEWVDGDPLTWFDTELSAVFGVDVLATPFDRRAGHGVVEVETARVLVIRTEDLDRVGGPALAAFLGVDSIRMMPSNEATSKDYGDLYTTFKRQLVLPETHLDRVYGSELVRHFYSVEEIAENRGRWSTR